MSEIEAIKAAIVTTKADLASAKAAKDKELIFEYSNILTEQLKKENILLAGSGNLLSYR